MPLILVGKFYFVVWYFSSYLVVVVIVELDISCSGACWVELFPFEWIDISLIGVFIIHILNSISCMDGLDEVFDGLGVVTGECLKVFDVVSQLASTSCLHPI